LRRVDHYCQGGYEDEYVMPGILQALAGCKAVLVARIGHCPKKDLAQAGIEAVEHYAFEYIEASVIDYYRQCVLRRQSEVA
jgi:nitrogen fixation protein NifB